MGQGTNKGETIIKDETNSNEQLNRGEKLLKVLVFTLIFSVMNASIFNVVLPVIGQEFDLTPSSLSWISTGYMIVYAIGSVTYGKLADKFRLKDLLAFGLIVFALGSIVGLVANQYWMIVLARVLQASGASVIPATGMIIPVRYFPPEKRGRALGTSAIGLALGSAMGPIVSGLVTGFASWRFLFLLSVLPLLTLPFYRKYLDDERGQAQSIDFIGGAMLAGTVALLLLSITQGSLYLLLGALALTALMIIRLRTAKEPFIQPSIFRNRNYSIGLVIAFTATAVSFGMPFITPQFLNRFNDLSPAAIGFVMFPAALVTAIMGRWGGRLADSRGNTMLVLLASGLLFTCFTLLSVFVGTAPYWIMLLLIFGNVGQSFMGIAMSNTVSRTLTREQTGVGMGLFSMLNFIAGAVATSLIGKLLDKKSSTFQLNPFMQYGDARIYSNIFLVMGTVVVFVAGVYYFQFNRKTHTVQENSRLQTAAHSSIRGK
ncbi:MAG: antiporter [Paenibacillaceae bacterium]|jgi:DHA2 family metal-tetracycline-proton antiporter-like MFS transporter|nr:antiporter [Paenibacillaceae bacterium]